MKISTFISISLKTDPINKDLIFFKKLIISLLFIIFIVQLFMPLFVSLIAPGFVGDIEKINLAITGCMGRMGQQLIKSSMKDKKFKLVSFDN